MSLTSDASSSPVLSIVKPLADSILKLSALSRQVYDYYMDTTKVKNPSTLSRQWEEIESLRKQVHQLIADYDNLSK